MIRKDMNEENEEIKRKAYDLYGKHGFRDGNTYGDWLEAERQLGKRPGLYHSQQIKDAFFTILGILCITAAVILMVLLKKNPNNELSLKSPSAMKVMVLMLDLKDMPVMKKSAKTNFHMAGYTSAQGTEDINQKLIEGRANEVREYLIEKGIAPERITIIRYGRTKPAVYEEKPGGAYPKETKADMGVLF